MSSNLNEFQLKILDYLALTDGGVSDLRAYQVVGTGQPVFPLAAEKKIARNELSSAKRSLKSRQEGRSSKRFELIQRDYDPHQFLQLRPGRKATLKEFTQELYDSQWPATTMNSTPKKKGSSKTRDRSKAVQFGTTSKKNDTHSEEDDDTSSGSLEGGGGHYVSDMQALGTVHKWLQDHYIDGKKVNWVWRVRQSLSRISNSGPPFGVTFAHVGNGSVISTADKTVAYDVVKLVVPTNGTDADGVEALMTTPPTISQSGRAVIFTLSSGKKRLLKLEDMARGRIEGLERVGCSTLEVSSMQIKHKTSKHMKPTYTLAVVLPKGLRVHGDALQDPTLLKKAAEQDLGTPVSAEILHQPTNNKTVLMTAKGSVDGLVVYLPVESADADGTIQERELEHKDLSELYIKHQRKQLGIVDSEGDAGTEEVSSCDGSTQYEHVSDDEMVTGFARMKLGPKTTGTGKNTKKAKTTKKVGKAGVSPSKPKAKPSITKQLRIATKFSPPPPKTKGKVASQSKRTTPKPTPPRRKEKQANPTKSIRQSKKANLQSATRGTTGGNNTKRKVSRVIKARKEMAKSFVLQYPKVPNDADGNCLARAISQGLYKDECFHVRVRSMIATTMKENPAEFSKYVPSNKDLKKYIKESSKSGCWLDEPHLKAAAMCFDTAINVVHMSGEVPVPLKFDFGITGKNPELWIYFEKKEKTAPHYGLLDSKGEWGDESSNTSTDDSDAASTLVDEIVVDSEEDEAAEESGEEESEDETPVPSEVEATMSCEDEATWSDASSDAEAPAKSKKNITVGFNEEAHKSDDEDSKSGDENGYENESPEDSDADTKSQDDVGLEEPRATTALDPVHPYEEMDDVIDELVSDSDSDNPLLQKLDKIDEEEVASPPKTGRSVDLGEFIVNSTKNMTDGLKNFFGGVGKSNTVTEASGSETDSSVAQDAAHATPSRGSGQKHSRNLRTSFDAADENTVSSGTTAQKKKNRKSKSLSKSKKPNGLPTTKQQASKRATSPIKNFNAESSMKPATPTTKQQTSKRPQARKSSTKTPTNTSKEEPSSVRRSKRKTKGVAKAR